MGVKQPQESDIEQIMLELAIDENGHIEKPEFVKLIIMVFQKMLTNELELIQNIENKGKAQKEALKEKDNDM